MFEEFVAFANDSDMEDVLTLQTKLYRCAHIFLGKCLAPVTGGKGGGYHRVVLSEFQKENT